MGPMVSVVATFYNLEDYAARCVASILRQTYPDFEAILIDDGSTDNTLEVIKAFESDSRVRVISQENAGVGAARNRGVSEALGEYITFVDGDDFVSPYMLNLLTSPVLEGRCDMSVGRFREIPEGEVDEQQEWASEADCTLVSGREIVEKLLYWELSAAPWGRLTPRAYYEAEPFVTTSYEDIACAGSHYLEADRIAIIEQPIVCYVLRTGSVIHQAKPTETQLIDYLDAIDCFLAPIEKQYPEYASALAFRRALEYARVHALARKMTSYSAIARELDQYVVASVRKLYPLFKGDGRVPRLLRVRYRLLSISPALHDGALRVYESIVKRL